MATFHVYSRQGCHLCEVLIEELLPMLRGRAEVEVHDIDLQDEWRAKYDVLVPVLEFEGESVSQFQLDVRAVRRILEKIAKDIE